MAKKVLEPSYLRAARIRAKAKGVTPEAILEGDRRRLTRARPAVCLDADELEQFAVSNGSDLTSEQKSHLESCHRCSATVDALSGFSSSDEDFVKDLTELASAVGVAAAHRRPMRVRPDVEEIASRVPLTNAMTIVLDAALWARRVPLYRLMPTCFRSLLGLENRFDSQLKAAYSELARSLAVQVIYTGATMRDDEIQAMTSLIADRAGSAAVRPVEEALATRRHDSRRDSRVLAAAR